ncbi:hypothetical protein QBC34DRAFT_407839 [Podospora aff. communis PSN243]|uniref:Uncharacterized protein n=1 Tax=Podospora aff. communis PSN243 TaxID=3040156 RepID=A0AAV9GK29_9PEZI|nr:hypothetical protein QBC34DRAFT_407839 [Podospora aff. communis PSN243]
MTSHLLEDVPPPPYTETDIYSHSGGARSPISPAPLPNGHTRHDSGSPDDAATQSTSSTNGDNIIYTPPLTPRSSSFTGTEAGTEADHLTVSSATAYFDTRPAPATLQALPQLVHVVTIPSTHNPNANDVPFPAEFASQRDIRVEDWQTFVNYLLPHHAAARNENVIERKLRAEGSSSGSSSESVEAQLGQIRSDGGTRGGNNVDAMVREWNEGFFGPRGVVVQVQQVESRETGMPGAWEEGFDGGVRDAVGVSLGQAQAQGQGRSRFARFNPFGGLRGASGSGGENRGSGNGNGGFRFGGIAVDGDRVSIGNQFVADRNGVRIGGIVADTNGISVNGQPMFGGGPPMGVRGCHPSFGHQHGGWGGRGFGGGFGGPGFGSGPPWGRGQFSDWGRARGGGFGGPPGFGCGYGRGRARGRRGCGDNEGPGFGRGRARGRHHDGERNRTRDSSVLSSSSSSSSSSESSIGSLPDYDELKDTQLPVTKGYLQEWLNHPDQPVTKEMLKEAKQNIKQARTGPKTDDKPSPVSPDPKALRKEIKAMIKEWKSLKKQQTRARKQLRRERKQKRREEKRELRNTRREVRRAERELRRNGVHGPAPPMPSMPPMPPMPSLAPMPPMPPVPPVPPVPPFQARGPGGQPWSPMGLGQMFVGWGGQNEGTTQANNGVGPSTTPGAWPGDDYSVDRHHHHSQAKYKAAADLEAQVIAKEAELLKMHEAIALGEEERRRSGQSVPGDHKVQTDVETNTLRLETEIEALARSMAQLRTEADEEYARELAEEERRGAW